MEQEVQCVKVSNAIEKWKKSLLDLSKRNKLLYLTDKDYRRVLNILSPNLYELIDQLVINGKSLTFDYLAFRKSTNEEELGNDQAATLYRKGDIETNLSDEALYSILYRMRREMLTWEEEQGIHTLFLVCGFLNWSESPTSEVFFEAPIILIPVTIERETRDKQYLLKFVEEEIVVNPALIFIMEHDFGLRFPDPPEDWDSTSAEAYYASIEELIGDLNWSVSRIARVGRFTYQKFVMYNDLSEHSDDACKNDLIMSLAKIQKTLNQDNTEIPYNLDDVLNPKQIFPVLDADSSQTEVLLRVKAGQNLVVQGPPGTGKSQTIANIIAQGLRNGKKILFVSEKIAALEVVNRRLKQSDLSFACLEIHSHKSDKVKVVHELNERLNETIKLTKNPTDNYELEKFIQLRDNLNSYVKELHKPRGTMGISVFNAHSNYSKVINARFLDFQFPLNSVKNITVKHFSDLKVSLENLQFYSKVFDSIDFHPWGEVKIRPERLKELPFLLPRLLSYIGSLGEEAKNLLSRANELQNEFEVELPNSIEGLHRLVELTGTVPERFVVPKSVIGKSYGIIVNFFDELNDWARHFEEIKKHSNALSQIFLEEILLEDIQHYLEVFLRKYKSPLRFLNSSYRKDRKMLTKYYKGSKKLSYKTCTSGLEEASKLKDEESWKTGVEKHISDSLGGLYLDTNTDWNSIVDSVSWIKQFNRLVLGESLGTGFWKMTEDNANFKKVLNEEHNLVKKILQQIHKHYDEITKFSTQCSIYRKNLEEATLDDIIRWVNSKKNPSDLQEWIDFSRALESCKVFGLENFLETAKDNKVPASEIENVFFKEFWKHWLYEIYSEVPVLSNFSSPSHEYIVSQFRELDKNLKKNAIETVKRGVLQAAPVVSNGDTGSQTGLIRREAQKRRRIMPIRKLFSKAPHLVQALKPCMLMSPLSVAEYLGNSPFKFDLVIFDEASQIVPADAIGAIIRGSQLVVAGDDKQLPPTRFFQADLSSDDEEDDADEPLESILDECLAIPDFHRTTLRWHYRSKHEELIDFSNKSFYDSKLITFPSPDPKDAIKAVKFHYVREAVYDRGKTRTNIKEAKEIANLLEKHFSSDERRRKSVGVIALSLSQEEAINNEWEKKLEENKTLSNLTDSIKDEPLFIKALEKVQGDERDIIILSIGYGKGPDGNISLNFGPLNKNGGERRLNVAVTRAREEITVVSSILPHELDLTRLTTRKRGIEVLQNYLEYASNGISAHEVSETGSAESEFELAVKERLESEGFKVDSQVGCSGFRIDLAIKYPRNPNKYVLGVECDGATYHSQRSARDRDRLRQEVLERLGWKIFRIWSTGWIKDPDRIIEAIKSRVSELEVSNYETTQNEDNKLTEKTMGYEDSKPAPKETSVDYGFYEYTHYKPKKMESATEQQIERMITEMVKIESPVHKDAIIRKISETYPIARMSQKKRKYLESLITRSIVKNNFQYRDNFLWNGSTVQPRVAKGGEEQRPIEEIPLEEISLAIEKIVDKVYGITIEGLIKTLSNEFGYKKTGNKMTIKVKKAVGLLLGSGKLQQYNDQLVRPDHH